jgi:hypothetical protein
MNHPHLEFSKRNCLDLIRRVRRGLISVVLWGLGLFGLQKTVGVLPSQHLFCRMVFSRLNHHIIVWKSCAYFMHYPASRRVCNVKQWMMTNDDAEIAGSSHLPEINIGNRSTFFGD